MPLIRPSHTFSQNLHSNWNYKPTRQNSWNSHGYRKISTGFEKNATSYPRVMPGCIIGMHLSCIAFTVFLFEQCTSWYITFLFLSSKGPVVLLNASEHISHSIFILPANIHALVCYLQISFNSTYSVFAAAKNGCCPSACNMQAERNHIH